VFQNFALRGSVSATTPGSAFTGNHVQPVNNNQFVNEIGATTTFTATPASGYRFANWSGASTSTNATVSIAHGTANQTLTANFEPINTTINASAATGGVVNPSGAQTGAPGSTRTFTATPSSGFTFNNWTGTAQRTSNTTITTTATFPNSGSVTLIANFTAFAGRIVFNGNSQTGGTVPAAVARSTGQAWPTVGNNVVSRTGMHLLGWYTTQNTGGVRILQATGALNTARPADHTNVIIPSNGADVTLWARWSNNTGTVRFLGNNHTGGTPPTSLTNRATGYNWSIDITVPSTFVRTGWTLVGFYDTATTGGTQFFQANGIRTPGAPALVLQSNLGNFDLYARWTANTGQVRFNGNDHTHGTVPTQFSYVTASQLPATIPSGIPTAFARTGHTLIGFYDTSAASGGTRIYNSDGTRAGDPRVLTVGTNGFADIWARWLINTYTIIFDTQGGTPAPAQQTRTHGQQAARPAQDPQLLGHVFLRWERADQPGIAFDFNSQVTSNLLIIALFTPNLHTVVLDLAGGTGAPPYIPFLYGHPVAPPVSPVRFGHTFSHWTQTPPSNATRPPFDFTQQVNTSFTLYAVWTLNQYTITIHPGDGSNETHTIYHGETLARPSDPTTPPSHLGENSRFLHWSLRPDGNSAFDFTTAITRPLNLYAVWSRGEIEPSQD